MYAIEGTRGDLKGLFLFRELSIWTFERGLARRFPTIDAAREAYRALPNLRDCMIVCADEDRK